ncbi:MAG: hypothetical protein ASARMPREDX12_002061 [Alectoria sarmentosa]|nr:MAG: hypothetical protein ASARMPREDX12_002061 [Alectoria sarmentosa]
MASSLSKRVKLTPDLFQTFRRYKKATGAVVSWLAEDQDGTTWSLDDLMQAALATKTKNIRIPPKISQAFELAIGARTEISDYFTQKVGIKDASTLSHEHFTKTLRSIYKLLRFPQDAIAKNSTLGPQSSSMFANAFEELTLVAPESEPSSSGNSTPTGDATLHATSEDPVEDTAGPSFVLKDDHLARDFELFHAISSLNSTCVKIKECWVKAAEGSMSMLFAAWLTTAAFEDTRRCFNGGPVSTSLNVWDHWDLYAKYIALLEADVNENNQKMSLTQGTVSFFLHGLQAPWIAILKSQGRTYTAKELRESVFQKPAEHVTVEVGIDERQKAERSLMDLLLRSIRRLLYQKGDTPSDFVLDMNPLLRPLRSFYGMKGSSIQTDIVFGLHLLVESYKSFTLPKKLPSVPNGRVQMLRFAQDVKSSLNRARLLRPWIISIICDCSDCLENALSVAMIKFEAELAGLATERRFDLYYQAPWVVGHQMNEILSRATDLGLRLCNRMRFVGTVLHLYNMLRQHDAIEEETIILEKLCAVLAQGVFSGSRPDCNFFAKYAVFTGGRISFDRSKRHKPNPNGEICPCCGEKIDPSNGADRNWRITIPKYSTKMLYSHDISAFDGLYGCHFRHARDELSVHPCASVLDHLEGVVGAEFEGSFPVAKVNWLEIYITCTEILANCSRATGFEKYCPDPEFAYNHERWTFWGRTFVEDLLTLADKFPNRGNDGSDLVATQWETIGHARKAIRTALEGKETADFLWAI